MERLEPSGTQVKGQAEKTASTARTRCAILTSCAAFSFGRRRRPNVLLNFSCFKFDDAVEILMRQMRLVQRTEKREGIFLTELGQQRKYLSAEIGIEQSYGFAREQQQRMLNQSTSN